jgi:hypothetical protein
MIYYRVANEGSTRKEEKRREEKRREEKRRDTREKSEPTITLMPE